jgi:hypothetical protein
LVSTSPSGYVTASVEAGVPAPGLEGGVGCNPRVTFDGKVRNSGPRTTCFVSSNSIPPYLLNLVKSLSWTLRRPPGCTHYTVHEETEIQQVSKGLSLADTQTGPCGRLYSRRRLDSTRSCRRSTLLACSDPLRTSPARSCIPVVTGAALGLTLPSVTVLRVIPIAGRARESTARGFALSVDLSLAELRPEDHRASILSTADSLRYHCKLGGGSASIPGTSVYRYALVPVLAPCNTTFAGAPKKNSACPMQHARSLAPSPKKACVD